jgi:hypothetical protein
MDSTTEKLLDEFRQVARRESSENEAAFSSVAKAVLSTFQNDVGASSRTGGTLNAVESAFSSVAASVVSSINSDGDGGGVTSALKSVLKAGFGVAPLITSLFGLFGGGGSAKSEPKLVKYVMPESMEIERASDTWGLSTVDYDQTGMPRAYGGVSRNAAGGGGSRSIETSEASGGAQQITVNIQAMDARSFLDRSADIAAAVRNAMLNLNSVNDVMSDL